ncbi:hypothetical protein PHYPSEUDO_002933 [Phytophthora pseudosyringae]|uniref:Uncharacterized protein n=1 Tax=Phytophthora pseudosyringae TaxID=221518 RepID=A0A8T1VVV8_9STRA|nr:hypothetical protein PHYPSEUDO_002933 [Phytophthora pseudosyringae]
MDRLCRELAIIDLDALRAAGMEDDVDNEEDTAILVAERIFLETWNRFAELDVLPRGLQLRQLVWDDGRVWIVEYLISRAHEGADGYYRRVFDVALPSQLAVTGQANLTGPDPNGQQVTYAPDYSFVPNRSVPGLQVPHGVVYDEWVTVVIEVMRSQPWRSVRPKVAMYRQLPGVQYMFCLKMSRQLNRWSYEFYDVGVAPNPSPHHAAPRHAFDLGAVPRVHDHFVHFDSRRVFGLPNNVPLPGGCQDAVVLDVVALARYVHHNFAPVRRGAQ